MDRPSNIFASKAPSERTSFQPSRKVNPRKFQVICRVRPQDEPQLASDIAVNEEKASITITSDEKKKKKEFIFHKIYNEKTLQSDFTNNIIDEIFKTNENLQDSLVLAYGVTNSGKTYTILGTNEQPGLLPVLMDRIFDKYPEEQVHLMAIESYNDEFYSLKDKKKLYSKEIHGQFDFEDYKPEPATRESMQEMIRSYTTNRSQTDTKANKKSSRSHAIFKIVCPSISVAIVDLAGSERLNKAGSNLLETSSINTSLLVLGKCIHAFRDGKVIPFRESKLTKVLSQYFNPEYKIFMIAHINRSGEMFHENVNVLEYAAVSTNVKHLNFQMNKSLFKSAKKRQNRSKSPNCVKCQPITESKVTDKAAIIGQKISKLASNQESDPLLEVMKSDHQTRRKKMIERYIYTQIGYWAAVNEDLDRQFEELDRRDKAMIEQWRNIRWQTPKKIVDVPLEVQKAETRIKLRQQILEELAKEKEETKNDVAVGTSLFKSQSKRQSIQEKELSEVPSDPKDEEYISENEDPSFFQKVIASTKKLASVKCKMNEYVNSAINIIKSYSHKKEKSQKKARILSLQNELNWCINGIEKRQIQTDERGCGSFKLNEQDEEDQEYIEKFTKAYKRIELSTDSEDSQLLDSVRVYDSKPKNGQKEEENAERYSQQELPAIRESEEYGHPYPSPHFKVHSNQNGQLPENRVGHHQEPQQVSAPEPQKQAEEPQQSPGKVQSSGSTQKNPQKSTEERASNNIAKIEEQPQKHPYLRKRSKMAHSVDKDTKANKKLSDSTSVSSFNQDSNSTVNMKPRGRRMKNKSKNSKDGRHPMQFKVCRSISPLQTRAQRNKKVQGH